MRYDNARVEFIYNSFGTLMLNVLEAIIPTARILAMTVYLDEQ